jgi:hypothetical protein
MAMPEDRKPWQHEITFEIDETMIPRVTDETLAFWWSVAQHNPASPYDSPEPGELAMKIGWEIIRRWLKGVPPELYAHQQKNWHWKRLTELGKWLPVDGKPDGNGKREYVPHVVPPDTMIVRESLEIAVRFGDLGKKRRYEEAISALDALRQSGTPVPDPEEGRADG